MTRTPVVLIHGAWFHMSSWEGWTERLTAHGYVVSVPGWPGEADTAALARSDPGSLRGLGLAALTAHYAGIARSFDSPPVLIGHSAGGLIARKLVDAELGRAAVALAPLPEDGAAPTGPRPPLWSPRPADPVGHQGSMSLTRARFRHTVANAVGQEESDSLFEKYAVPAPRRLLADLGLDLETAPIGVPGIDTDADEGAGESVTASADLTDAARGPLLLVSGQEDRMVADSVTRGVYKMYGDLVAVTDLKQFADRGHSLAFDSGWRSVADHVLTWLAENGVEAVAEA